eukprot:490414-Ditylum_brightwellii.AAC.1
MTQPAKQHWLDAVHIAVKGFTQIHGLTPTQQNITTFFSPIPSCTITTPQLSPDSLLDPVYKQEPPDPASSWFLNDTMFAEALPLS